ncbi:peptidoglycan DD-transpeptidase MrdA [Sodalis sp. CWE]|nr:peptidoglycan DD-transpeptidase MrdA [Sodalis sp. CWE]
MSFLNYYSAESALFMQRVLVAIFGILLLSVVLVINLYHLQVTCFKSYQVRSDENRIRIIPIEPNRGLIYDRNGIPLALNRISYQLELIPDKVDDLIQIISDLRHIVDLSDEDISNFEKARKRAPRFTSLPLKTGLTEAQQARFAVNQYRFPHIEIKGYSQRYYPYGSTFTHVIGYVSKIDNQDIKRLNKNGILSNYVSTHNIGKLGIERYYENILHGKTGYEEVEVNNRGRLVRQLCKKLPQAGKSITLTLDLGLQQYIEKLLIGSRSAVVVLDPRDGSVQAMISSPSYDPNLFVNGISKKKFQNLLSDKNRPLINRATQGTYPPASTVKPYISVSALSLGVINKNYSLYDPGWWQLPGSDKRYRDWKRCGHGQLNVVQALEESADTFFYQVAYDMGIDRLFEWMTKFGYGKYTGIDLSEEHPGVMPNRQWKIAHFKKPWYQGDTIPIGIGQGYWTATPIQMSKALMTLINNGTVLTPHLLRNDNYQAPLLSQLQNKKIDNSHPDFWKIAKDGMYGVANRENGTAWKNFFSAPYKAAVKSGTAQVYSLKINETYKAYTVDERLRDHKLMTAFAPYNNPTVCVVAILENGGIGRLTVGEITRLILDYLLLAENTRNISNSPITLFKNNN